jgi:hypothetical protein
MISSWLTRLLAWEIRRKSITRRIAGMPGPAFDSGSALKALVLLVEFRPLLRTIIAEDPLKDPENEPARDKLIW